ncbi:MAG: translation initiation factor IF-3 [Candidatus Eisenbacteria bacterium]|uniref:Translation initiation factor IF-3 n=1 Tax=Eiseniibacteriota bacterium TaxID=2212470 RepID=A0A937X9N5_UNCEI|nr:translation initiation factor IF-3 [Candidatus Eisenbacteria bacterium]
MVRVVDEQGEQVGVMAVSEALRLAKERDSDLVEVAPMARPPVCRIMDYGRYKYEQAKRLRKAKQKTHQAQLKEIKMRPKIGEHDYQVKVGHAREFLAKRDKVKFSVRFRGREIVHLEFGERILRRVIEDLEGLATVESGIRQEGHTMTMVVSPRPAK